MNTSVVLALTDPTASDRAITGAKAANLALGGRAGLPVIPGSVITARPAGRIAASQSIPADIEDDLNRLWRRVSVDGSRPLAVRSSATVEDTAETSMAGLFASVLNVHTWERFVAAVVEVASSGDHLPEFARPAAAGCGVAVLVQPMLESKTGGVLFGSDPITGRTNVVLAAAGRSADAIVSGREPGAQYRMHRRSGIALDIDGGSRLSPLGPRRRWRLARLARAAAKVFGSPQDLEWAFDSSGRLWLLQSRPITTVVEEAHLVGPVLGVGPVAETFPLPLAPLEEDLWLVPLRNGLAQALLTSGLASRHQVARSEVVVSIGGRVAADLQLMGVSPVRRSFLSRLDLRPPLRRLGAAWRVGRLHVALPRLAREVLGDVDSDLSGIPELTGLSDTQLLTLLSRSRDGLACLHAYEVLVGFGIDESSSGPTAASEAMVALVSGRAAKQSDQQIVEHHPQTLVLTAPKIAPTVALPPTGPAGPSGTPAVTESTCSNTLATLREALRLRSRWVQELGARAAWELGYRLTEAARLSAPGDVARLRFAELEQLVRTGACPVVSRGRVDRELPDPAAPLLPPVFRRTAEGGVVAVRSGPSAGRGGGGGVGQGPVHDLRDGPPAAGSVLVVRALDPSLAGYLPGLAALVAETGSALSHIAILAREQGIATAVSVTRATERFRPGAVISVDGSTGEVVVLEPVVPAAVDQSSGVVS